MNKTNFILTGGWPLKAERLQEMQTAYQTLNAFGSLAGNLTIISGCDLVGTTIKNGFVFINNELFEFREAVLAVDSTVIIIEENIQRAFKNGVVKTVHTIRYATFGTNPDESWLWSDFKKPDPMLVMMERLATLEKKSAVFQSGGGMVLWNKPAADIPEGWHEVVDWRGRFPVGMDTTQAEFNTLGKQGGSKSVTSTGLVPASGYGLGESTSQGTAGKLIVSSGQNENAEFLESLRKVSTTPNISINTSTLSPYRTVLFIEYIG